MPHKQTQRCPQTASITKKGASLFTTSPALLMQFPFSIIAQTHKKSSKRAAEGAPCRCNASIYVPLSIFLISFILFFHLLFISLGFCEELASFVPTFFMHLSIRKRKGYTPQGSQHDITSSPSGTASDSAANTASSHAMERAATHHASINAANQCSDSRTDYIRPIHRALPSPQKQISYRRWLFYIVA